MTEKKIGRKEQRRIEEAQKKRKRAFTIILPAVLVAGAIIALVFISGLGSKIEGLVDFGAQDQGHDEDVVFADGALPPVGGTHSPRWQTCGIYDSPVESKNAVHSMEHGAVWITYRPDLPAAEVDRLRDYVRGQSYLLLSPFPSQAENVVMTAWGIQLPVDSADDNRIAQFIDDYRLGPQTPEFGASCDSGVGQPLS